SGGNLDGFYWGSLSGAEAKRLLSPHPPGAFLVRDSSDHRHLFTLSLRTGSHCSLRGKSPIPPEPGKTQAWDQRGKGPVPYSLLAGGGCSSALVEGSSVNNPAPPQKLLHLGVTPS
uniref:SH2 domain-containing protein n=1 Tax=Terrapene triunguis TaxID=2587831 RepID=A0A674K1H3_9SAUR